MGRPTSLGLVGSATVEDATVIVVGGGHNGLICAAYLARAGIDTLLLEARATVGGCASTESDLGARFNICHCDHTMIRATPVVDELDLARHGLRYLEPDACNVHLFHDHSPPWVLFQDPERTVESIAAAYPEQVDGYRRYLDDALPMAKLFVELAATPPSALGLLDTVRRVDGLGAPAARRMVAWSRSSIVDVLGRYLDDHRLVMPAVGTGPTVWGVPPDTPGTGLAALGYAVRHTVGTGRPEGGSGALTDAVASSFVAAGGSIRCSSAVTRLLVDDGSVTGVELTDGTRLTAATIVAACDPQRVLVDWVDEVPPAARPMIERWRAEPEADGYESKLDAVLTAPPRFAGLAGLEDRFGDVDLLQPTAVVCPTPAELAEAHRLRSRGRVADRPSMLVNAPSVLDPTMAPAPGHHVLSLETLFTPYDVEGGWPGSAEPERWLRVWGDLAEGDFCATVDRWRAMTPDRYEREFSMHRGHTPAYKGSPLASLVGRRPELTRYRTPIGGLYLSGAGTYPGAGIFGASGRNAAGAVIDDLAAGSTGPRRWSLAGLRALVGSR